MTKYNDEQKQKFYDEFQSVPEEIIDELLATEKKKTEVKNILSIIESFNDKQLAVFEYLDNDFDEVQNIQKLNIDDNYIDIAGQTLLVLTDSEADTKQYKYNKSLVEDDCPNWLVPYVDIAAIVRDTERGQSLASYDGCEYLCNKYTQEDIYIYRN